MPRAVSFDNDIDGDDDRKVDINIDVDEHSPESAGLARGIARSAAQKGASRVAVGRLPAQHVRTTTSSATTAAKVATKTARVPSHFKINSRAVARPSTAARVKGGRIRTAPASGGGATAASKVKAASRSTRGAPRARTSATPRASGRVNVRRVARASDRASTGLDLVEAASSEQQADQRQQRHMGWRAVVKRIPTFVASKCI